MLSHCERPDEEVVLLHVGRQTGQSAGTDKHAVQSPPSADLQTGRRAEHQRVQERRFPGATGPHDGQQLSRVRHSTHCQREPTLGETGAKQ